MPQTLSNVLLHAVFHKGLYSKIVRSEDQSLLNAYIISICDHLKCPCLIANGPGDHEHLLFVLSPQLSYSEVIKEVKRLSSAFLKKQNPQYYHSFYWQAGYGMFSVSYKSKEAVYQYIVNQQQHHQQVSVEKEWISLLKSANITDYQPDLYWIRE